MNNEIIYNEIGKLIKRERKRKCITQEQLANLTNYSLSFIANIESNTFQSFSIHTLYNIANALNISVHNLLPNKKEILQKKYQLICENCKYNVDIPNEIGKFLEEICHNKKELNFTCPYCQKYKIKFQEKKC